MEGDGEMDAQDEDEQNDVLTGQQDWKYWYLTLISYKCQDKITIFPNRKPSLFFQD